LESIGIPRLYGLAVAAADWGVVEADVAAAAGLAASREAVAAGLQDIAASLVAGGAADAAAVLGVFALANTAGQVALADADSVLAAAAAAEAVTKHPAEILQGAAGDFVFALAVNLETAGALFELDLAAGQDAPIGRRGGTRGVRGGLPALSRATKGGDGRCRAFE
jgi:hypothetical protein